MWDTRKHLQFASRMKNLDLSMLDVLRKVDSTFEIRDDQLFTAVNAKGFEVDILRREAADLDPHPLQLTDDEDDLWAVQARRANVLLGAPSFSAPIVSVTGRMARMTTISPAAFVDFKRWMASTAERDPLKISRDRLQASIVEELANRFRLGV
ncbi:GSU2403 family nucleotidyltransferase fold protein [Cupriavidus sp. BIC8F]|uniref:GSU2403 family nucleotidyltransferase fold protein n=1 Tax=Cupriavidus sp. BIC8F TaxID=3079014 RepID=UPI0029162F25|nr:GSU2403 family nucleotidyltransferase fold protein [Cupriavidus sp. BIC8F]